MRKFLVSDAGLLTVGAALVAVVVVIDSMVPLGVAGSVPYVAIVLAGMWIAWRPAILILAGLATLLTIVGFYTSPAGGEDWQVLANRTLAVAMIWVVALLIDFRRRRENLLVHRERALGTAIVQSVGAMVIILDPTGHITRCNRTCEEITGRTQNQLIGRNILDLIDPTDAAATVEPAFDAKTAALGPCRCETFVRSRENGRRRISWSSTPHFGTAGAVDYLILAGTDITEQYRAREDIRKSEELHRNVVENQIDLIARSLPDGTLTFVNDVYCSFFGRSREQLIGRNFILLVHESDRGAVENRIEERTRAPAANAMEIRMLDGSGEPRWVQWTAKPITDENGMILEFQSVGRDVTERRRVEDALRESEERHRQLANISPLVILVQCEGRIVFANPAAVQLFAAGGPEELIGRETIDLVHPKDREQILEQRAEVRRSNGGPVKFGDVTHLRLDSSSFIGEAVGAPFRWSGKDAVLFVIQDVTDLRRAEADLRKAKDLAEQATAKVQDTLKELRASLGEHERS